jgi:hypothetical protein
MRLSAVGTTKLCVQNNLQRNYFGISAHVKHVSERKGWSVQDFDHKKQIRRRKKLKTVFAQARPSAIITYRPTGTSVTLLHCAMTGNGCLETSPTRLAKGYGAFFHLRKLGASEWTKKRNMSYSGFDFCRRSMD